VATQSAPDSASSDAVIVERRGAILLITLNRPSALNSVNRALSTGLGTAIERLAGDDTLRVGIITGVGRAFCAGMDLKAWAAGEPVDAVGHPEWGFAGIVQHPIDKPLIAAVNGLAFGGGFEIALATDLIVADEEALFGFPEVSRGLLAIAGGLLRIGQQLPPRIAAELVLTGRRLPAPEAAAYGLINSITPSGGALDAALALAQTIVENAPLAVQASVRLLRASLTEDSYSDAAWQRNAREMEFVFGSADAAEGARAFAEKRKPVWTGE
jgi:crotonobetainyl-CoA hydratase